MLLRAVSVYLLLSVAFSPSIASAADVLDYQKIGPVQIVERMAQTLIEGSSSERRSVTEEAHEWGEKYLATLGEDEKAVEYFQAVGEAFIPLFWTAKSTTRVRSERILAEFVGELGPYLQSPDDIRTPPAFKLLERYASLMMVAPGNASSGKLLEKIRQIFEQAKYEFTATTATEFTVFEGLPNPDPAFGKNEGEETVAVAKVKEPPLVPVEPVAVQVVQKPALPPTVAAGVVKTPRPQEVTRVVSASGNKPVVRPAPIRRVSAKPRAPTGGGATVRVSAKKFAGVTGAVVSVRAPRPTGTAGSGEVVRVSARPARQASRSSSPAALRILNEQLQSDDEARLLSAFGLARQLYEEIRYSAREGVGAERETAEKIVVRARMLVGSASVSVQKAAIPMVAELGDDRSVGQLIRLLSEKQSGVDAVALAALKKLTGKDYGYSIAQWQKWQASRRSAP